MLPFGLDHLVQGIGQRGQADNLSRGEHGAIRPSPVGAIGGPPIDEVHFPVDRADRARSKREAHFRILDGAGGHFLETHGAPALEHGQCTVQRTGHDRRVESVAVEVPASLAIPVDSGVARCPALTDDRRDFSLAVRIHEDQRFAAQAVEVLFDDAARQQRGDAGIERVAAVLENLDRGGCGQGVAGGHAAVAAHHGRTQVVRHDGDDFRRRFRVRLGILRFAGAQEQQRAGGKGEWVCRSEHVASSIPVL